MFDPEFDGMPSVRALPKKRRRNPLRRKLHVGAALIAAVFGAVVLSKPHASGNGHAGVSAKSARVAFLATPLDGDAFSSRFEGEKVAAAELARQGRMSVATAEHGKGGRLAHAAAFAQLPETMDPPGWRPDAELAAAGEIPAVAEQDTAFAETPADSVPLPQFRPAAVKAKPAPVVAETEPDAAKPERVAAVKPEKPAAPSKPEQVAVVKPEAPKAESMANADKPESGRKRSLGDVVLASLGGDSSGKGKAAEATARAKAPEPEKTRTAREDKPRTQRSAPLLGFAANESPSAGGIANSMEDFFKRPAAGSLAGKRVAVYDISAATVTMPDGRVLEAHSGLGAMKDNPRYVKQKMNGPTPPDVYKLSMREKRFHGVAAIRMTPADGRTKHGRTGFLAHTALVRGTNGSHGCVAFKDYNTFLNAFKSGKITHMVVVN